jgi:ABC-type multidrug transport system ATPase subunit
LFDLEEQADSPIRSYSAGQKKKIALCGALITDAEILLLDEPFSGGLDPSGLLALKRVLKRLVADRRCTVVLTSPVAEIVEEVADRVALVEHGQVVEFDTVAGLRSKAHGAGSLGKLLEEMLYPQTVKKLQDYFRES